MLQTTWHAEPEIVTACLEVTSVYVPWIDITTVANDKFLPLVLQLMRNEYARAASADLLCQVVDKGMEHLDKLQLITRMLVLLRNFEVPLLSSQVSPCFKQLIFLAFYSYFYKIKSFMWLQN